MTTKIRQLRLNLLHASQLYANIVLEQISDNYANSISVTIFQLTQCIERYEKTDNLISRNYETFNKHQTI